MQSKRNSVKTVVADQTAVVARQSAVARPVRDLKLPASLARFQKNVEESNDYVKALSEKSVELTKYLTDFVNSKTSFVDGILQKVTNIYVNQAKRSFYIVYTTDPIFKELGNLQDIVDKFGETTRLYKYSSKYAQPDGKKWHDYARLSVHSLIVWMTEKVLVDNDVYVNVGNFVSTKNDVFYVNLYIRDVPLVVLDEKINFSEE